jgi:F-type H+-transporting ATPase subunit gamma
MAGEQEIRKRIKSVSDTLKITNAMYMISSAKLTQAKKMLSDSEPYYFKLQSTISRLMRHVDPGKLDSVFLYNEEKSLKKKKIGYIVVTADKGLAGGYNHNILKMAEELVSVNPDNKLFVVGEVGRHYCESKGMDVDTQFHYTAQNPTMHRARIIADRVLDCYIAGEIDEIDIIYTEMVSSMNLETQFETLLPLHTLQMGDNPGLYSNLTDIYQENMISVMDLKDFFAELAPLFVIGEIYGALVESFAAEHCARMQAMQNSMDSAKDMLNDLQRRYQRARQAAITQEITEVIAGAKSKRT